MGAGVFHIMEIVSGKYNDQDRKKRPTVFDLITELCA